MENYALRHLLDALKDKNITVHTVSGAEIEGTIMPNAHDGIITLQTGHGTTAYILANNVEAIEFEGGEE